MTPRRPPDLDPKGRGDKRMVGKRGTAEDGYAVAPQRLNDRAKAGLPEPQSPAVEDAHPLLQRLERSATRGGSFAFRDRPPPTGGAMKNDFIEGDEWDAYVALDTFSTNGTRDGLTGASPMVTESP